MTIAQIPPVSPRRPTPRQPLRSSPSGASYPDPHPSGPIPRPAYDTDSIPQQAFWQSGRRPRKSHKATARARFDRRARTALAAALWLLILLAVRTWEVDRGVQDVISGGAARYTSLGRLTGLVSAALLLAQVVLMARIPLLENAVGRDRLVRLHRVVGFWSFDLMVAHIVLITWGNADGRLAGTPATLEDLVLHEPGILLAALGTVALVLVVLTSIRAARRRLRYESWHLLHLYAYLGAGLALPHQLWTGQEFTRRPLLTAGWWAVWALAAAAVLVWRIGVPVVRTVRHDLRVQEVVREGPGLVSVYLTGRELDKLAEAGQFLVWRFLGRPGWTRANPYSLSAAPQPDLLRITVREAGDGSRSLAHLRPGTRVLIEGAYGRLSARARTRRRLAFIGAGAGLAPLRALAEGLSYAPGEAVMLERYTEHPFLPDELEWLASERGLRLIRLPGRRRRDDSWVGAGYGGFDDVEVLRGWVPDLARRDVFLCGPPQWAESVRRAAIDAGLDPQRLHVEAFGW